jgi:hypothetical protein
MDQFVRVLKEFQNWGNSVPMIRPLIPFHQYVIFSGLAVLSLNVIFIHYLPVFTLGHYLFFLGAWLTLMSGNYRLLPYALWGYALYVLYPFSKFTFYEITEGILYGVLGYLSLRLDAYVANRGGH